MGCEVVHEHFKQKYDENKIFACSCGIVCVDWVVHRLFTNAMLFQLQRLVVCVDRVGMWSWGVSRIWWSHSVYRLRETEENSWYPVIRLRLKTCASRLQVMCMTATLPCCIKRLDIRVSPWWPVPSRRYIDFFASIYLSVRARFFWPIVLVSHARGLCGLDMCLHFN
jgi:hypothetical protein